MKDYSLDNIVNGTVVVLSTTSSDEHIYNIKSMSFPQYESEEDPEYWNKKFKKSDWDHLYD